MDRYEGGLCCGSDVVRNEEGGKGEKGICFRKCRCGSQVPPPLLFRPYEIISTLRVRWPLAAPRKYNIAARIIRKINYFPGLLINFTITPLAEKEIGSRKRLSEETGIRAFT